MDAPRPACSVVLVWMRGVLVFVHVMPYCVRAPPTVNARIFSFLDLDLIVLCINVGHYILVGVSPAFPFPDLFANGKRAVMRLFGSFGGIFDHSFP